MRRALLNRNRIRVFFDRPSIARSVDLGRRFFIVHTDPTAPRLLSVAGHRIRFPSSRGILRHAPPLCVILGGNRPSAIYTVNFTTWCTALVATHP